MDGIVPKFETRFRLGSRGQQLHGEFVVRAEAGNKFRIDSCSFFDRFRVFFLNHESLRQIQANSQDIWTVWTHHARKSDNQISKCLLRLVTLTQADVGKAQPLFESQARALIEFRKGVYLVQSCLEILGGGFCIVLDERDHSLRGE